MQYATGIQNNRMPVFFMHDIVQTKFTLVSDLSQIHPVLLQVQGGNHHEHQRSI